VYSIRQNNLKYSQPPENMGKAIKSGKTEQEHVTKNHQNREIKKNLTINC